MRQGIAIWTIAAALVAVASAMGGWPGKSIWLSLPPAIILGAALSHIIEAWLGHVQLRLLFSITGVMLGTFGAMLSLLFMAAANAPADIEFEASARVEAPQGEVWKLAGEPTSWGRWDAWLSQIEPTAAGPVVQGAEYETLLALGGSDVPAVHTIVALEAPRRLAWHVRLPEGSAITDVREQLVVTPEPGGSLVTYRLTYHIPTTFGRAVHAIIFEKGLNALARQSAANLAQLFLPEPHGGAAVPGAASGGDAL